MSQTLEKSVRQIRQQNEAIYRNVEVLRKNLDDQVAVYSGRQTSASKSFANVDNSVNRSSGIRR